MKILIVDGFGARAETAASLFAQAGYDVSVVTDGGVALELIREHRSELKLIVVEKDLEGSPDGYDVLNQTMGMGIERWIIASYNRDVADLVNDLAINQLVLESDLVSASWKWLTSKPEIQPELVH
jgi:CheY-like chemotaxis protein